MKRIILLFTVASTLTFSSCQRAIVGQDGWSSDPMTNFDYIWTECDEKYSYFDLKEVDWNQMYIDYSAKIYPEMSEDSLFHVLGGLFTELKDDHTNLITPFNISRYGVKYNSQDNYDYRIVLENYLSDPYRTGPFTTDFLAGDSIGYIRFSSFTGSVGSENIDYILEKFQDTEGIILDLRENGGGAVSDVFALMSRFLDSTRTVFHSRIKSGPGHNEFSAAEAAVLNPVTGAYTKKVALLTDRGTYSAGSFTSLGMKAIPHIRQIGDTTGGGLGVPNGGQLPNGWTYRFSITQSLDLNLDPQWEQGVPPDTTVLFDWNDRETDEILEAAMDWITE